MHKTPIERVERATRLYRTGKDAGLALGITKQAFARICRRHQIETPRVHRQNRSARVAGNAFSKIASGE